MQPTPAASRPAGASRTAGCRAIPRPAATSSRRSSRPRRILDRPELVDRAHRIIDWELSIQHPDGAFPGHFGEPGSQPVIFNTGQIMHGMLAGYLQLGRKECLESAVRAGHWLARHQDADGCWRKFEHNGVPHTYNTRGTWALLATGAGRRRRAA